MVTSGVRLSRWNKLTLQFFGPPSVGAYEGAYPEAEADPVCPFCGELESNHERSRMSDGKSLRRCPSSA